MTVDQKPLSNIVKMMKPSPKTVPINIQSVVIHHLEVESQLKLVIAQLICAIQKIQTVQTIQKIRTIWTIQKIQAM